MASFLISWKSFVILVTQKKGVQLTIFLTRTRSQGRRTNFQIGGVKVKRSASKMEKNVKFSLFQSGGGSDKLVNVI